jgi:signal transduction histidine kinase
VDYTTLQHGRYLFHVRAALPDGQASEASLPFEVLPHVYETVWFQILCAVTAVGLGWMAYQYRLRQVRSAYDLVLQERLRLAREIHDTLTQAFVGICSQLDALQRYMPENARPARQCLDLARRMARHSLTEAHRSVMDLRAEALDGNNLAAALNKGARSWAAGSGVGVDVNVAGESETALPQEVEQNVLRIAQEAVTNVLKHAAASRISLRLLLEPKHLKLEIEDNGQGFEQEDVFIGANGHFGLIGMRERAARIGGELRLDSQRGKGTRLEVVVPLA